MNRTTGIRADEPASEHPILRNPVVGEVSLPGLQMAVGSSGADAFHVSYFALPLDNGATGLIALHADDHPSRNDLKLALSQTYARSSGVQEAAVRFLHALDREYDVKCAFVGIWEARVRRLTFFAAGFAPPSVFNADWPHRAEFAVEREMKSRVQRIAFGVHRLEQNERWLLYTAPLVDVADPYRDPFNSVGIIQYAHDDRWMRNDLWVNYLLKLGVKAHKGSLPTGSIVVSIAGKATEATEPQKTNTSVGSSRRLESGSSFSTNSPRRSYARL